jgi:hypothetical protein
MHPNSLANLEPTKFKKGNTVKKGAKYVQSRTILKKMLAQYHLTNEGDRTTVQAAMMEKMINMALLGDTRAFNVILDRIEGKPIAHTKEHDSAPSYLNYLGVLSGENINDDSKDEEDR